MPTRNKTTGRSPLWIYMLECENGAYYTGYTTDLARRYQEHRGGRANAKYTRSNRPVRVAQCWRVDSGTGDALKLERFIKTIGRPAKERLVDDPDALQKLAAEKIGSDVQIVTVDPKFWREACEEDSR